MKSLGFLGFLPLGCAFMSAGMNVISGAAVAAPSGLYSGYSMQPMSLEQALAAAEPGTVVVIGENHGFKVHQKQQLEILNQLRAMGLKVSVGLEFFSFPDQKSVTEFATGLLPEADFLKAIRWSGVDFGFYRDQALFPDAKAGSFTLAVNSPRALNSKIAKDGLGALAPEEMALLPPQFAVGNGKYKARFKESIPHVLPPADLDRWFTAHSLWDDTVAWQAQSFLDAHPDQVLVLIMGEFHVQYGGGLPDRLAARGLSSLITFSQINTSEYQDAELPHLLQPSVRDGIRSDFLWLAPANP